MFLDVAYLVRDLLSHPDYDALRIKHVTLVAFLPEMFRNSGESLMPRLRQNAYAALRETAARTRQARRDALKAVADAEYDSPVTTPRVAARTTASRPADRRGPRARRPRSIGRGGRSASSSAST